MLLRPPRHRPRRQPPRARAALTRTHLLLALLVLCALGFAAVKILQATGVIRASGRTRTQAEVLGLDGPRTYTIDDIIARYRGSDFAFKPDVGVIMIRSVVQRPDGTEYRSSQYARGHRERTETYDEDGYVTSAVISDGSHVWILGDDGFEDAGPRAETYLLQAGCEPLFLDLDTNGCTVASIEYRGDTGFDGPWLTLDAPDGSTVEYKLDMHNPIPLVLERWTMPEAGGDRLVRETRFEGYYGIRTQAIPRSRTVTFRDATGVREYKETMVQCAQVPTVPDAYFTPDAWDSTELWDLVEQRGPN